MVLSLPTKAGFGSPDDFDEPHDIFIGGSQDHVYVADRRNNRVQVFDQDGNFIAAWKQFGQPSSVFVGKDDTIYVGASFPDPAAKKGELRGIGRERERRLAQVLHSRPCGPRQVGCRDIGVRHRSG
jgi:DNA-binding beta-propeller fold protein YncE